MNRIEEIKKKYPGYSDKQRQAPKGSQPHMLLDKYGKKKGQNGIKSCDNHVIMYANTISKLETNIDKLLLLI